MELVIKVLNCLKYEVDLPQNLPVFSPDFDVVFLPVGSDVSNSVCSSLVLLFTLPLLDLTPKNLNFDESLLMFAAIKWAIL